MPAKVNVGKVGGNLQKKPRKIWLFSVLILGEVRNSKPIDQKFKDKIYREINRRTGIVQPLI